MKSDKKRYLLIGLILGVLLTLSLSPISAATQTISAFLRPGFQFYFDGEATPLPAGQTVLVYEGRSYVPARFVAENLGASVLWDEVTQSIIITSPETVIPEPEEEPEEPVDVEEPEEEEENLQPSGNYRTLPVTRVLRDMEITVTLVTVPEEDEDTTTTRQFYTRIYLEFENKSTSPLQIQQGEARIIVDGKEYSAADVPAFERDGTWYNDVQNGQTAEGYLVLPRIPINSEELYLSLKVLTNDRSQTMTTVEMFIELEL